MNNGQSREILTVFIPIYGYSRYLEECLTSISNLNLEKIRVVILEDFPNQENNEKIVAKFSFEYIKHQKNLGLVGNFNFARSICSTSYFMIIGPDDLLIGKVDKTIEYLTNKINDQHLLFMLPTSVIDDSGERHFALREITKNLISMARGRTSRAHLRSILIGYWPYSPSVIWRQISDISTIKYREQYELCADFDLLARHFLDNYKVDVLKGDLSLHYRRHGESLSGDKISGKKIRHEERELFKELRILFARLGYWECYALAVLQLSSRSAAIINLVKRNLSCLQDSRRDIEKE